MKFDISKFKGVKTVMTTEVNCRFTNVIIDVDNLYTLLM